MADLLKSAQPHFVSLRKGENLEGTITKLTSSEILVDVGAKTEAQVLEKDRNNMHTILSTLKVGDKVMVSVLNPESDFGNPVVSLRRFIDEKLWGKVTGLQKDKKQMDVTVTEETRGGFLVKALDGIQGFLPNSHVSGEITVGQKTKATLLEFDRLQHKIIFSQKKIASNEEYQKAIKSIKVDQKITSTISSIAPFGIFVNIKVDDSSIEGFIHVSEIAWQKLENVPQEYKIGDEVEALVLGFDRKSARVNLSIKRLVEDPYKEKLKSYSQDKKVKGTISEVTTGGIKVDLEDGVEGFIKKDKIPVGAKYEEGQTLEATVVSVD